MSKVTVENVNTPGRTVQLDARRYEAARDTLLGVLPDANPGLTQAEMIDAVRAGLPADVFPGGEKAGWWTKAVQLDLEAKGRVIRVKGSPTRWRRA